MTIKEQLSDSIYNAETESIPNSALYHIDVKLASELCEQVVSDIAIKFADWYVRSKYIYVTTNKYCPSNLPYSDINNHITSKELFELFKKENNL